MTRFTLLIFSRNDIDKALGLIKDMYGVSDEIVILDGSDAKPHQRLLDQKRRLKLSKLRVYPVPALGYPDPLRMYGLSKCRNEWVFLIDTDERISPAFKSDLHKIIGRPADAFAIKRIEDELPGVVKKHSTWQTRLFKKSKTIFKGLVHEQAAISGKLERLEEKYYMEHHHTWKPQEYSAINRFDRLDYASYHDKMLAYLAKLFVMHEEDVTSTISGRALSSIIRGYMKLFRHRPDRELSDFDYFVFYFVSGLGYTSVTGSVGLMLQSLPGAYDATKRISRAKRQPEGDVEFEVSRIINDIGITRFLDLDKESTILRINKRYPKSEQGIGLLIRLLTEKYKEQHAKRR